VEIGEADLVGYSNFHSFAGGREVNRIYTV